MVRDDIPLIEKFKKIPQKRIGLVYKSLCANCLSENHIIDGITGRYKCLSCGANDFKTIRLSIWIIPEPTGHEL